MKKFIISTITSLMCIIFLSSKSFSSDIKEVYKNCLLRKDYQTEVCDKELYIQHGSDVVKCGRIYRPNVNELRIIICYGCYKGSPYDKEVYKNCLLRKDYQTEFCSQELYTQHGSDVVKCGRIYSPNVNELRIIICYDCYTGSPYDYGICASDRNAYATTFHNSFKGTVENFPKFLFESAGSDLKEMLLKEREMFRKGFRAIYHVCNRGHWQGDRFINNGGNKYVFPLFFYQLFGALDSFGKGGDINSPEFIPCIPRYNNFSFDKVPNRESFI